MTTSTITLAPLPAVQTVTASITMEGSSLDGADSAKIEYYLNGTWYLAKNIVGKPGTHTFPYSFSVSANGSSAVAVRITSIAYSNDTWRVWSGRVTIGPVNPLPVELLCFLGEKIKDGVMLDWSTTSENNCDFFTVERSADGKMFSAMKNIPGFGNSSTIRKYSLFDSEATEGLNFYRLTQTDLNEAIQKETGSNISGSWRTSGAGSFQSKN